MKKLLLAASLCGLVISGNLHAQTTEKCAFDEILRTKLSQDPTFISAYKEYTENVQKQVAAYKQHVATTSEKTTAVKAIPVVFHVVLTQSQITAIGGTPGIHIRATHAIEALNRDFNRQNPDSTRIPAPFKSLYGNAEIIFSLAHRKPDGSGTSGVEIKVAPTGFGGFAAMDGSVKKSAQGGLDPWDNTKYLNIWVCLINTSGVLGYGYSPDYANLMSVPDQTGVVITHTAFGQKKPPAIGTFNMDSDSGRTLVHEVGHFLNLWHIWGNTQVGNGDCNDDDFVNDTPKQEDANFTCYYPGGKTNTCTSGQEMYMNFMDYTGDECIVMFTKGQVTRMQAQLAPGGSSHELTTHPEIFSWPTDVADIEKETIIDIMPNPSTGIFTINMSNTGKLKSISVTSMMGQTVRRITPDTQSGNSFIVDLSSIAKGVYMVHCQFSEGTVVRKIVLQ